MLARTTAGVTTKYRYGLERLGSVRGSTTTWEYHDRQGSVRLELTGTGSLNQALRYDAWGQVLSGAPAPFGYTGELRSATTGLEYLRARWYNPATGTLLGRDPFAGDPEQPYSLHPYQYGYSQPTRWSDPSGQCIDPVSFLACAALVGLGVGFFAGTVYGVYQQATDDTPGIDPNYVANKAVTFGLGGSGIALVGAIAVAELCPTAIVTLGSVLEGGGLSSAATVGSGIVAAAAADGDLGNEAGAIENAVEHIIGADEFFLFRGTTEGYPGNDALQTYGVTPTSTDPGISTIFATYAGNYGKGVVYIATPDDLSGIGLSDPNALAEMELEVMLKVSPTEFANRASTSISAEQGRQILAEMGISIPPRIDASQLNDLIRNTPHLTSQQIQTFVEKVLKLGR